jgi:drug/metabolite transporter (DMT)-like permease
MVWVVFALAATFFWAWTNILDKVLRTDYLKNSIALTASFGVFGIIFAAFLFFIIGVPSIPFQYGLAAFVAGFFVTYGVIPYIKALSLEEASRVVPLWHLLPLFTLVLAVIFLNEVLTLLHYVAFALILLGGFLISVRRIGIAFHLSPAVAFMSLSSFLVAIAEVLMKFAYSTRIFWETFFVFFVGIVLSELSLFILPAVRRSFAEILFSRKHVFLFILFLSVVIGFTGHMLYNAAVLTGPITLVSVFISFQSLFVLLIATFLSLRFPLFIKEAIDVKTISMKMLAIVLMASGLLLLSF